MLNKKKRLIVVMLTGVILAIVGLLVSIFLDKGEVVSRLSGLIFSLGFGLIGGCIGGFVKLSELKEFLVNLNKWKLNTMTKEINL